MRIDFTAGAANPNFVLESAATVHELQKRGTRHNGMPCPTDKE
jgi:hypothetical protein